MLLAQIAHTGLGSPVYNRVLELVGHHLDARGQDLRQVGPVEVRQSEDGRSARSGTYLVCTCTAGRPSLPGR